MRQFLPVSIGLLTAACSVTSPPWGYQDWDSDKSAGIDQGEFVAAYLQNHAFSKWSSNRTVTLLNFYDGVYTTVDKDGNNSISRYEFDTQVNKFYYDQFREHFKDWDADSNDALSRQEFIRAIEKSSLAALWDTSCDGSISELEMAGGMYYYADQNKDQHVDDLEFNIWKVNLGYAAGIKRILNRH